MKELHGGELKVWYIPQIPGKPFEVTVPDMATAALVLDVLTRFSLFEYENRVKPDYADMGGVCRYARDDYYQGWEDVEEGELDTYNDLVADAFANSPQES